MKKAPVFLLFIFMLSIACNKGSVDLRPQQTDLYGYSIDGIYDVTLSSSSTSGNEYGKAKLRLSINPDSTMQDRLNLSVSGLPANVTAVFTPAEGQAPFTSTLVFSLNGIPDPGKYPLMITLGDASGKTRSYPMNLTIPIVDFGVVRYEGAGDIYLYNNGEMPYADYLNVIGSGILDTIDLFYEHLPAGVEASFLTNHMPPPFTAYVSFKSTNARSGTYPITLVAKSSGGLRESYQTNLIISGNCASAYTGNNIKVMRYVGSALVDSTGDARIVQVTNKANQLSLYSFTGDVSYSLGFSINCNDNTIVVNKQGSNIGSKSGTIEGTGTINPATREIILDCVIDKTIKTQFHIYP